MKKLIAFTLASILAGSVLAGCNKEKEPASSESSSKPENYTYQDGEYSVRYDEAALDRTLDYITVSIKEDQISITEYGMKEAEVEADTSVLVNNPDESDASASSEASSQEVSAPEEDGPTEAEELAAEHAAKILDEYDDRNGDLDAMEPVSGAEEHTYRFIRMMRTALAAAETGDTSEMVLHKYADGDYTSTMPDFSREGWKEFVKVTVSDGKIQSVVYDGESSKNGQLISESNETKKKTCDEVVENFISSGEDLGQMTAVDKTFNKLMTPLLASMVSGGDTEITASRLVDGEYKATFSDFDENGWKDYVVLKIKNGTVTVQEYDAVSQEDEKKLRSMAEDVDAQMKEKTGITYFDAVQNLTKGLAKAQQDVTQVDNVTGATVTSNNFKLLVGQLLATAAVEGNTETLEVERLPQQSAA